jgi:5-methylcytosine-specific restriction endonuclease McrA
MLGSNPDFTADFFARPDSLKQFRDYLSWRTSRQWSIEDLDALFARVKLDSQRHYREPVPYGEYLKLLWQAPLECARCKRRPPEVMLHVDHILPASRGGPSKRNNLQFLCSQDNLRKSNKREVGDQWLNLR